MVMDIHNTFHGLYISHQSFSFKQGQTHIAIHLADYLVMLCNSFEFHQVYSTVHVNEKTTRTELFDGISQQTPQLSRICRCLLWVHKDWFPLPSAAVYDIVLHYADVIMIEMASQITSLTVVYSIVNSGADQSKHQSSASLAFVRGIHRDRWIPRTKGQ